MSKRRQNFQNIAWFHDIYKRGLLDMDPPYQRRSVWNVQFQQSFIDTILLDYPAPAIFLFSRIEASGLTKHELVDGKQRLTSVLEFLSGNLLVSDESPVVRLRGKSFNDLNAEEKLAFWEYDFPVEYLPTNEESVVNGIFDRLNRNVAKLSNQELRHARYSGRFISQAEELTEWMSQTLNPPFPRITEKTRRQMKDVEITATLLLFLELGYKRLSVDDMDEAFSTRDSEWEQEAKVVNEFRDVINAFSEMLKTEVGEFIPKSRFMNQADFYSLFAAIAEMRREMTFPPIPDATTRLHEFDETLDEELPLIETPSSRVIRVYLDAARSGSHDTNQRLTRISITKHVLAGNAIESWVESVKESVKNQ